MIGWYAIQDIVDYHNPWPEKSSKLAFKLWFWIFHYLPLMCQFHPVDVILMPKGPCNQLAAVVPNGYTTKAVKPVVAGLKQLEGADQTKFVIREYSNRWIV